MKKLSKIFMCLSLALFSMLPFILTGCGENLLKEGSYQMINMQVICDNTEFSGYSQYDDGAFTDCYARSMQINKSSVQVSSQKCTITYYDLETNVKALYNFERYNDSSEYPAFKYVSCMAYIGDTDITNESEDRISELDSNIQNEILNVLQFKTILSTYESSIQIVTVNKTFVCHILLKQGDNFAFMGVLYGF